MDAQDLIGAEFDAFTDLITMKADETPTLEFKRKPSPGVELQRDDKKLLGEAISGFANATGGILIIGIGTENHEGLDRASVLAEIDQVDAVASRYRAYAQSCTSPPVEAVEVRAIHSSDDRGVIAIYVPKGQARPHMSNAPGHHTYYRRVIDKFLPMEAYEVEEMMRLKTSPKLELVTQLARGGSIGNNRIFYLLFGLTNQSRVTAKFPYLEYFRSSNGPAVAEFGLDGNGNSLWQKLVTGTSGSVLFAAGADRVIHPGQSMFISRIEMCEVLVDGSRRDWGLSTLHSQEIVDFRFEFGCEDCPREEEHLHITKEELAKFVRQD